jgi:hypothetical protein
MQDNYSSDAASGLLAMSTVRSLTSLCGIPMPAKDEDPVPSSLFLPPRVVNRTGELELLRK